MLSYDPNQHIRELVLVGCGGTGSQVARTIARITRMMLDSGKSAPRVRFVDPDIIETKNVGRQLFQDSTVGMYKAVELARRFNYALGLEIEAVVEPFNHEEHINNRYGTVIIGAVDNWMARKAIAKAEDTIWIDCGNSRHSGQVVIGSTGCLERIKYAMQNINTTRKSIRKLPNAGLVYPELLVPDPEEELLAETLSCAELLERSLQSATINQFVASIASEYLRKLLYREAIYTWFTNISTTSLTMKSTPITLDTLTRHTAGLSHIAKAQ